jgi:hypothetical protein
MSNTETKVENLVEQEIKEHAEGIDARAAKKSLLLQKKRGRKTKVPVDGAVVQVLEKPENEEEPKEISYNGAKEKLKQKRQMTDKQKENIQRLIELNKKRREEQKKADEEQAEKERKAKELEDAKLKKKTYIVKPKRPYVKKKNVVKQEHPGHAEGINARAAQKSLLLTEMSSNSDNDETEGDTTDTRTIKKKLQHIQTINNKLEEVKTNPYLNLLKKSGF